MALTIDEELELSSLKDALLKLRTGRMPSKILYNGRETDFAKVDLQDLKDRVTELTSLATAPTRRRRGAVGFRF
jgi:hypothetical protein